MEKAYDFDIPEDISEIPDEHPDEIEGKDSITVGQKKQQTFAVTNGLQVPFKDPVQSLYNEGENFGDSQRLQTFYSIKPGGLPSKKIIKHHAINNPEDLEGRVYQKLS